MRSGAITIGLLLFLPLAAAGQGTAKPKWPIPSKDAQAKVETLLQEIFGADYVRAEKDVTERRRLAQKLLDEGRDTKDNVAGRYVLFQKAHQLAAQAGDVSVALQAADELAQDFAIPPATIFQMKIKMLQQASQAVNAPPDAYQGVIDRALLMLDNTLEQDDFASSQALIAAADQAARKLRSIPLLATIRKKHDNITRREKEFARWQKFADLLAQNPSDTMANQEMGKYYALIRGNWERGLPLLAKGGQDTLSTLAQHDLAAPKTEKERRVVALGWFLFAEDKANDPAFRTQALLRAYHWYQLNLSNASDEDRKLLEAKLHDISNQLPAEYRIGEIAIELKKIDVPYGPVYSGDFTSDGKRVLITGYDNALHLYNARTGKEIRALVGHSGKPWTVACANDGVHAASGGFDTTLRLWDLYTGRELQVLTGHQDYVRSVAISSDNRWLASGSDDRTVRIWSIGTAVEKKYTAGLHNHSVWSVAFSPDNTKVLSGSLDKTVCLWEPEKGTLLKKLEGHTDTVLCVAFMPDGRHVLSGSSDKTIRLWDLDTGKTIRIFTGSTGYVNSIAVTPDGRRILSGGADGMVRLWDAGTGKEIRKLEGHRDPVWHVAFAHDGRLALSCGQDGTVRIWGGAR